MHALTKRWHDESTPTSYIRRERTRAQIASEFWHPHSRLARHNKNRFTKFSSLNFRFTGTLNRDFAVLETNSGIKRVAELHTVAGAGAGVNAAGAGSGAAAGGVTES